MEQSKQQQIRKLTDRLNRCRYEYYNLNAPSLTEPNMTRFLMN